MATTQQTSEEKTTTITINSKRLDEMMEQFKKPISNLQSESNQLTMNKIDHLIKQCVIFEQELIKAGEIIQKLTEEKRVLAEKLNKSK